MTPRTRLERRPITDAERLGEIWADTRSDTWLIMRHAVLRRTVWRLPFVVNFVEANRQELRTAFERGREVGRSEMVEGATA